jgi:hypothetical protein
MSSRRKLGEAFYSARVRLQTPRVNSKSLLAEQFLTVYTQLISKGDL